MAYMTGPELLAYIKESFKRTDKDTELYEAITDTIMDMKIKFTPEDFKVVAYTDGISALGEYYFQLPSNFGYLIGDVKILDGSNSRPLDKISKTTYDQYVANPSFSDITKSMPECFCIYGGQIYLYPVPDSLDYQYELNYTVEDATTVDADSTTVDFSNLYRECLKYGAMSRMYVDLENDAEAQKYLTLYDKTLQLIVDRDTKNVKAVPVVTYQDL